MYLYKHTERYEHQVERKLTNRLAFAVRLHALNPKHKNVMDCPKVRERLSLLIDTVRDNIPTLRFRDAYMLLPGELCPGFLLIINHSATSGKIITASNNIIELNPERAA